MGHILDMIANSEWTYLAGTSGTATVPAGYQVASFSCVGGNSGGTLTITPGGGQQQPVAGPAIPIPSGVGFGEKILGQLGAGTAFVFAGTSTYFVQLVKMGGGF